MIIATNSLEHFETIADEIVLMSKGQCIVSDTVENLKDRYRGITQEEWHKTKMMMPW